MFAKMFEFYQVCLEIFCKRNLNFHFFSAFKHTLKNAETGLTIFKFCKYAVMVAWSPRIKFGVRHTKYVGNH